MRDCDVAWLPNKALSYLRVDLVWSGSGFGLPRGYGYLSRGQEPLSTLTSGPGTSTVSCASSQRTLNPVSYTHLDPVTRDFIGDQVALAMVTVSYTHLDVYKRQLGARSFQQHLLTAMSARSALKPSR